MPNWAGFEIFELHSLYVPATITVYSAFSSGVASARIGLLEKRLYTGPMERKVFWLTFGFLGLVADFVLPLWWAMGATIPIFAFSWWLAYRSGWF